MFDFLLFLACIIILNTRKPYGGLISKYISINKCLSTKPYQHGESTKKHENKGKKAALPRGRLDCYYPSQLLRSCFISFLKRFREGQFLCCCGISFHVKAPVNWQLFFVNSNRGLGRCKS